MVGDWIPGKLILPRAAILTLTDTQDWGPRGYYVILLQILNFRPFLTGLQILVWLLMFGFLG